MKYKLEMIDQISEKMKEIGYEYFNVKYGRIGTDFKTAVTAYILNMSSEKGDLDFPIVAGSGVSATSPDEPISWATFKIVENGPKGLKIDSMNISLYECHDGALRTSLDLKILSLDDIPTKQTAKKMIEDKRSNVSKRQIFSKKPQNKKGRKL